MNIQSLRKMSYDTLVDLITTEGINASGKEEQYGCIFGRDSAITILKILKTLTHQKAGKIVNRERMLRTCKMALTTLMSLQGQNDNLESGEEIGKFIHEYRKDKYDHLVNSDPPWFVYPDGRLRNYDSLDATPLALIAIYRYWEISNDDDFLTQAMPSVKLGLNWLVNRADKDGDYLVEYELSSRRKFGGLQVQSWTDSRESLQQIDGSFPLYPIAPVEVQGYVWNALSLWGKKLQDDKLLTRAKLMKSQFNQKFIYEENNKYFLAQALDGHKNQINTVTANPLLILWASYNNDGNMECILDNKYIPDLVKRAMQADLFSPQAGLRTMSTLSPTYNPNRNSYHNGSFWPKVNGMVHEGLCNWGYVKEAKELRTATIKPMAFFGSPVELYVVNQDGNYLEFESNGQKGCKNQAWSAAVLLELTC